jgi:hypothetical protein
MVVAQEIREFRERQCKRAKIIAERAIKDLAGMAIDEPEPPERRHGGPSADGPWYRQ